MLKISKPLKHKITSRQLAPKVYDIVANIYCLKGDYIKNLEIYLKAITGYELEQNKSFDIDSKHDLEIVNSLLKI